MSALGQKQTCAAHKPMSVKTEPYQLSGFYVRCFGAIFRAGAAHVVLLGPVRIVQRTPDLFPDLGWVLQMFSDVCHRRMTAVPW